ncbi:hypothetical protein [Streptomyces sp. ISL-112]|nr:hypothetical protein [Streptomyces sp. ISL-112]
MDWWLWLVIAGMVAAGVLLGVQARRRSGGMIVVRRGRVGRKGAP